MWRFLVMNIFVLDKSPIISAQMQCDKHIVKMPLETAQMLCSVWHRYGQRSTQEPPMNTMGRR